MNYVKFDQIENFIFGKDYKPELRIALVELASRLKQKLALTEAQSQLFATYLVGHTRGEIVLESTKVLQCKVVTLLIQNLNMYC